MKDEKGIVVDIIKKAGEILQDGWNKKNFKIYRKGTINLVTEIDKKIEFLIIQLLKQYFPDYGILTEESNEINSKANVRWIIDPLDGTTNYIKQYPFVAISIALEKEGELILGVVYNPILNEMFIAQKGCGATYNGKPIHVSKIKELGSAVLASGFPYDAWQNPDNNAKQWRQFLTRSLSLRCDGSAALDLCRVACGQLDGYWEKGISPWDVAAGIVILREAGGIITDYLGEENFFKRGEVVAANPVLHAQMLKVLNN
ncbi:MAG TPA: inositol monophosphatase [Thermoanaerobacter sp.]|nr:inositol monophosphatase [Thermoanaerobacter sp.]